MACPRSSYEAVQSTTAGQATLPDPETFKLVPFICELKALRTKNQGEDASGARLSVEAVAVDPVLLNFITDDSFRGVEQLRCPLTAAARCFQRVHDDVSLKGLDG